MEAAEKKHSILFLPCHKSHVDYLVISYIFYRLGIALPHIAAGDNLNLPIVGWILKHGGAFFIRRSFGDDPLYQEIVKEYIELLLQRGHNIEVFIEGTRSRTGKRQMFSSLMILQANCWHRGSGFLKLRWMRSWRAVSKIVSSYPCPLVMTR